MARIEWSERFVLGLKEIDQHHRHLVGLLGQTHDQFLQGGPRLEQTLQELADYCRYHFKSEELWMLEGQYPGIAAHKMEHGSFIVKVDNLRRAFDSGKEHLSLEMIIFLEEWISEHILKTDATFGRFLLRRPEHSLRSAGGRAL